jgi:hypothetical protein
MSVLTPGGVFQETTNLLKNGAPVVTGSDSSGQNLTLHSNNSIVKGTVLLDENTPAYSANTGALQAIGGISTQHNLVAGGALVNNAYGFSVANVMIPAGFGGTYNTAGVVTPSVPVITIAPPSLQGGVQATAVAVMNNTILATTATTGSGSVATISFATQTTIPFQVGQLITVNGVTPVGYNGQYTVTAATVSSVSYANATSAVQTVAGTISSGTVAGVTITNPGTGYTTPPLVTFQDPSVQTAIFWLSGATAALNTFVKAVQTTTGQIYYYQVTVAGVFSTTPPSHVTGSVANGGATLLYLGTLAQGYSAVGYSGAMLQGAIHEVGCVNQTVITAAGSAYAQAPLVNISAPDLPGGKRAQAMCTISGGAVNAITVLDAGSGYLYPPVITFSPLAGGGSGAAATAVISSPGVKPIVSIMPTAVVPANTYFLDFGLTGSDTVVITATASSSIYFDSITGLAPYVKGFPLGRKVTVYVRNISGGTITITLPNLLAVNSSSFTQTPTISATRVAKFEFIVLTQTVPGGVPADVYASFITS